MVARFSEINIEARSYTVRDINWTENQTRELNIIECNRILKLTFFFYVKTTNVGHFDSMELIAMT